MARIAFTRRRRPTLPNRSCSVAAARIIWTPTECVSPERVHDGADALRRSPSSDDLRHFEE